MELIKMKAAEVVKRIFLSASAAALAVAIFASSKAAAFNITPMLVEIDAKPGVTYSGTLVITGAETRKESVKMYFEDWDKLPDGNDNSFMPGTLDRSCANWITVSPKQIDLPPNGRVEAKFTIAVPVNATGTYWTFIMAEENKKPDAPPQNADKVQFMIQSVFRYAVRVFVNISDGAETKGEITSLEIFKPAADEKLKNYGLAARVAFKNDGNYLLKPQGYMEIRNLDGETVSRAEIPPRSYVIPGRERFLEVPIDKKLPAGDYIALAAIDYGGDEIVAGEAHFTVAPEAALNSK
jgi:hypothetical protein